MKTLVVGRGQARLAFLFPGDCAGSIDPDQVKRPEIWKPTYGHLFPGRGKEASGRYEKSMQEAGPESEAVRN